MCTTHKYIIEEEDKVLLGIETDAVIHPWTVMIHMCDTALADRTMMGMRWLDRVALFTLFREDFIQIPHISSIDHYMREWLSFLLSIWSSNYLL